MHELEPPVEGEEDAVEMVRFWIVDGSGAVSLNLGIFDEEAEPASWGMIAADIVVHAVHAMTQERPDLDAEVVLAQVENAFRERLSEALDINGGVKDRQVQ